MKSTELSLTRETFTYDAGPKLKVKKGRKRRGKTFAHQLEPLVPKKYVDPEYVPEPKLEGKNLRRYALAAFAAAVLVGPATVLARAHVDYLGGHRDLSIPEQIECVIKNPPPLHGMGFTPKCPIRQSDWL